MSSTICRVAAGESSTAEARPVPSLRLRPDAQRCPHCGAAAIMLKSGTGRNFPYRNLAGVPISDTLLLPTCPRCDQLSLDAEARAALAPVLAAQYRQILRERARRAIKTLVAHISQSKLEKLLGLSHGYLCRVRAGKGTPSFALEVLLTVMAADPAVHLSQISAQWSHPEQT